MERLNKGKNLYKSKTTISTAKRDINSLPFDELGRDCQKAFPEYTNTVEAFCDRYGIKKHGSWVYPQVVAALGRWTPVRGSSGKFDGKATLNKNLSGNDFNKGIYFFSMLNSRMLEKQYVKGNSDYCALVPIILSAFKKMQDIKYSEWENVSWLVPKNLYEAMTCEVPDYSRDELMQFRVRGMKANGSPQNSYGVYHLSEPVEREDGTTLPGVCTLPNLARMMVLQTWCAHPHNRNRYMILDPQDWDHMPAPLSNEEVLPDLASSDLPWDTKAQDPKSPSKLPWDE